MTLFSDALSFTAVKTDAQYRDLLLVRNECRDGLTHMTDEITLADQIKFRNDCWPGGASRPGEHGFPHFYQKSDWFEPYLLTRFDWPIGYGLLKYDFAMDGYWMTAGLVKSERGKGLSRLLILFITEMGHRDGKDVWIDVYDDNLAIFGDIRVGYEFVKSEHFDDVILHTMKHNRERTILAGSHEERVLARRRNSRV